MVRVEQGTTIVSRIFGSSMRFAETVIYTKAWLTLALNGTVRSRLATIEHFTKAFTFNDRTQSNPVDIFFFLFIYSEKKQCFSVSFNKRRVKFESGGDGRVMIKRTIVLYKRMFNNCHKQEEFFILFPYSQGSLFNWQTSISMKFMWNSSQENISHICLLIGQHPFWRAGNTPQSWELKVYFYNISETRGRRKEMISLNRSPLNEQFRFLPYTP